MIGLHQLLQSAATTGNGTIVTLNGEVRELTFYITADTGTVSAGVVTLEEAHDAGYAGTWSTIGTTVTPVSGSTIARHATGSFGAVRARISTNVTGGATVTVDVFGNLDV